ncbi:protein-disulfide reductase DsbD [Phytohalomonas tamaricis]|uniref:protein-disulfide reductase DsbD n=1 Tax=Phytohalomonas tamaricis TaxID=2081032 RepID=UPI000D0B95E7|nr:protein-disulfide reductase DsbD [Phytohalomonas tamaricis]
MLRRLVLLFFFLTFTSAVHAGPFPSQTNSSSAGDNAVSQWFGKKADFLPVDQAFRPTAWREGQTLFVGFESADNYYLYRSRFDLKSTNDAVRLGPLQLPEGQEKDDDYLGRVQVFHDQVVMFAPVERAPPGPISVTVSFQGCADAGLCYPPEHVVLQADEQATPARFAQPASLSPENASSDTLDQATNPSVPSPFTRVLSEDSRFDALLNEASLPLILGLFFMAGLGLTFTPCVLPMLPIISSIVVGQQAGRKRAFGLSSCYALGMAITYAFLGTVIGMFGASLNIQARLQSPWVLVPFALLFVIFALWLFDAFALRLPNKLSARIDRILARLQASGPLGIACAGALSTLVVSPCISAPLAGAMTFVSATGNALLGGGALLAMGLGMGVPLVIVSTFGMSLLPRSGAWMNTIKAVFGVMMLAVALWLLARLLPASLEVLLWGALSIGIGLALGALNFATPNGWPRTRQTVGMIALVWGIACVIGAARGGHDPLAPLAVSDTSFTSAPVAQQHVSFETITSSEALDRALAAAEKRDRPVFVDFYADWCISCRDMERNVLPRPEIAARLANFHLIRADVTRDSPESRALLERFNLFGPPSLLFFKGHNEIKGSRIQGEVDVDTLAKRLDAILDYYRS